MATPPIKLENQTHELYLKNAVDPEMLHRITNVGDFSFTAQTNFLGGWSEEKERRVTLLLQRTIQDALEASGFHNLASLEARRFRDGIEFQYLDPDYQFSYSIDGRGRIALKRPRSSAVAFHEWYRNFMPSMTHIVQRTIDIIDEELTGLSDKETDRNSGKIRKRTSIIQAERASYAFNVAVQIDHSDASQQLPVLPNIQVLNQTLLSRVPSNTGRLSDPAVVEPDEFGRIDYSVSRWNHRKKVAEHYSVSAPSNNRWKLLLFTFGYVGETYIPSDGDREKFNHADFLTGETTAEAYLDFFRQRSVCGFIRDVLYGAEGDGVSVGRGTEPKPPVGYAFQTPASW
ncbi:hypothetical protein ACOB87_34735 [Streptomyces sp. YS-B37]|uniref:hypothetical protein n=1 Tax=Streptomyces sp. YS-B37 TaxID=3407669 RepID=UPI003B50BD53